MHKNIKDVTVKIDFIYLKDSIRPVKGALLSSVGAVSNSRHR